MSRGGNSLPLDWFLALKDVGWQGVTGHTAPTCAVGFQQKALTAAFSLGLLEALCRARQALCGGALCHKPPARIQAANSSCSARPLLLDDWLRSLRKEDREQSSPQSPRTCQYRHQSQPPSLRLQRGMGSKTIHFVSTWSSSEERHLCTTGIAKCLQWTGLQ